MPIKKNPISNSTDLRIYANKMISNLDIDNYNYICKWIDSIFSFGILSFNRFETVTMISSAFDCLHLTIDELYS